ncbi:hypothetical protein LCGC14_1821410 [marine sediment metagenome]|uniref:30S ribosomal protein S27e n=1 Tax=marine sediment metagenome TaxID=412755 RepID=A0A0F9IYK1_9ZZZZ
MKMQVVCNKCGEVAIAAIVNGKTQCVKCGHTSVTFLKWVD